MPGRKVSVQMDPAWSRRKAEIRRRLKSVLMRGLANASVSCCQGEGWLFKVRKIFLEEVSSRRDFVPSLPAVFIFSHHSLCARMLFCRSPLRYLAMVVMDTSPTEDVVLSLRGMLPFLAKCLQKSIMPERESCKRPYTRSSV